MKKANPSKEFISGPPQANCACNECPFMRLNTLEKLYVALRDLTPRIEMDETLRTQARIPMERMLDLS
jgi:quinolinate synthase